MKKLFFVLIILGFFVPFSTSSRVLSCSDVLPTPQIRFYTSYGKLAYDYSKDQQQITKLANKYGIVEQGLFAAGLAVVNVHWEVAVNNLSRVLDNNKICVVPVSVDFYLGYTNPVIYLDRNLKVGSCHQQVVLRHEQTHQQINTAALEYFIPLFRNAIDEIAAQISAVEINNMSEAEVNQAAIILTNQYSERISPLVEVFKKELLTEQGKLDNHTNYEFEGSLCAVKK